MSDNIKEKIEYLQYCHKNIENQKNFIYTRASILIAVMAFVITGFLQIISENSISENSVISIITIVKPIITIEINWLIGLFLLSFLYTTFWAIKSLFPLEINPLRKFLNRKKSDGITSTKLENENEMVFTTFVYIANSARSKFTDMVNELDDRKILDQLIRSTYNVSDITKQRYGYLKKACIGLCSSIIILVIAILIG
ncbi:MAG: hypothetical protein LBC84_08075 [Prevotellaceae bacterium]|jgi:hypothetical protein|nr:hypothetical protein [Prevotellaceae bacterium]